MEIASNSNANAILQGMSFNDIALQMARRIKSSLTSSVEARLHDSLLLQGRMASWQVRSMQSIQSLQSVEFKVFSQWGEDGIIDWLIERAGIPAHQQVFIEFGVESYAEANTRFLLENRNWRGLILDGNPTLVQKLKKDPLYWRYNLTAQSAFITRENINQLISQNGLSGDIGLLSIDVDGVDYWIWEAINVVRPVICICEYNAIFGDLHAITVPYDAAFSARNSHYSYLYSGASIAALRSLAAQKGYRFLGTTLAANDAFFIREDYAHHFDDLLKNATALPSKSRGSRNQAGELSHVGGLDRFKMICDLPVVKIETGETVTLSELGRVYSDAWMEQM